MSLFMNEAIKAFMNKRVKLRWVPTTIEGLRSNWTEFDNAPKPVPEPGIHWNVFNHWVAGEAAAQCMRRHPETAVVFEDGAYLGYIYNQPVFASDSTDLSVDAFLFLSYEVNSDTEEVRMLGWSGGFVTDVAPPSQIIPFDPKRTQPVLKFLDEIIDVCKRHGFYLQPEDHEGALNVRLLTDSTRKIFTEHGWRTVRYDHRLDALDKAQERMSWSGDASFGPVHLRPVQEEQETFLKDMLQDLNQDTDSISPPPAKKATMTTTLNPEHPPVVMLIEDFGPIVINLDSQTPVTTTNFLKLVQAGHYNGTLFHRLIPGFMIQGGQFADPLLKGDPPTLEPIPNEADTGLKNTKYSIAMARTSEPHSAKAQFFINFTDNGFLNHSGKTGQGWGYCRFGEVVGSGREVIDRLNDRGARTKTTRRSFHDDVPATPIRILKAYVGDASKGIDLLVADSQEAYLAAQAAKAPL